MSLRCSECNAILIKGTSTMYCCDGAVCSVECRKYRYLRIKGIDKTLSVPNKWDEWLEKPAMKISPSMKKSPSMLIAEDPDDLTLRLCYSNEYIIPDISNNIPDISKPSSENSISVDSPKSTGSSSSSSIGTSNNLFGGIISILISLF